MDGDVIVHVVLLLVAVGLPVSIPIVIWVLDYHKRRHLMQLHHVERMAAIERGIELPPLPIELIDGRKPRRRRTSLLPGLVWFFIGLAVLISVDSISEGHALLGLIPSGVGLAYLIYYFVEGRKIEAQLLEHELRSDSRGTNGNSVARTG